MTVELFEVLRRDPILLKVPASNVVNLELSQMGAVDVEMGHIAYAGRQDGRGESTAPSESRGLTDTRRAQRADGATTFERARAPLPEPDWRRSWCRRRSEQPQPSQIAQPERYGRCAQRPGTLLRGTSRARATSISSRTFRGGHMRTPRVIARRRGDGWLP